MLTNAVPTPIFPEAAASVSVAIYIFEANPDVETCIASSRKLVMHN